MSCCDFNKDVVKHEHNNMVRNKELSILTKKQYYISKKESYLYFYIQEILPQGYEIKPQIQLLSLVNFEKEDISVFNKIKAKSIDYCIFKVNNYKEFPYKNMSPVLAIELDDFSHTNQKRAERDNFVNSVCKQINLNIVHINNAGKFDKEEIKNLILSNI